MGNFPYPSSYILNGAGLLPAFPVRVACSYLEDDMTEDVDGWLEGLKGFAGVYYNYTGELECNELSAPVNEVSEDGWSEATATGRLERSHERSDE